MKEVLKSFFLYNFAHWLIQHCRKTDRPKGLLAEHMNDYARDQSLITGVKLAVLVTGIFVIFRGNQYQYQISNLTVGTNAKQSLVEA